MHTPETNIYICAGALLNNDYAHTIYFDSKIEQRAYFSGKVVKTFLDYTTVRKSWSIQVTATMEEALTWSYLFFTNSDTGKTFYYFINNVEYISDDCTELFLEMDVMQTYLFDYALLPCFVEREHSATDEIGENLIEENLELGELVINGSRNVDMQELCILLLTSFEPLFSSDGDGRVQYEHLLDGTFSGLYLTCMDCGIEEYATKLNAILRGWEEDGKLDGVVSIWMYPKKLLDLFKPGDTVNALSMVLGGSSFDVTQGRVGNIDGYSPRNKKLWTYPYNFIYVSNNSGGSAVYRYEYFGDPTSCAFRITGTPSAEGGTKIFPVNYRGLIINYEEGLAGPNYPTCAWNSDVYKLWLAQNQNQNAVNYGMGALSIAGGIGMIVAGAFTGGSTALMGAGMVAGGATSIASTLARQKDMESQPPQARGNHSSNLNIANEHQTFTIQRKSISKEFAEILDGFFDMFGYACKKVKTPNRNVRKAWTYTKTQNCHISASLGADDQVKIQNIYNNGITFWKDGDTIGNYSLDNTI